MPNFKAPPKKAKADPLPALYDKLAESHAAHRAHREKHSKVYTIEEELKTSVEHLTAEIKKLLAARYLGKPSGAAIVYTSSHIEIEVTAKNRREIDTVTLLAEHRAKLVEIEGVVVKVPAVKAHEDIDISALDKAVFNKVISRDFLTPFIKVGEAMTPSVSFRQPAPKKES